MNTKNALPRAIFQMIGITGRTCLAVMLLFTLPVASFAQETTSSIVGKVSDGSGNPVQGADISVRHVPTGRTQSTTTNATGGYRMPKLRVGGPYEVTLHGTSVYGEERIEEIYVTLAEEYKVNLVTRTTEIEEIVVSASPNHLSCGQKHHKTGDSARLVHDASPGINQGIPGFLVR